MDHTDHLWKQYLAGNAHAFGELYTETKPFLYPYIRRAVFRKEDSQDVLQTVFLKIFEKVPPGSAYKGPFMPFVFRVAHNAVIDHNKNAYNQSSVFQSELGDEEFSFENFGGTQEPEQLSQILLSEFLSDLDHIGLSPLQREVMQRSFEGETLDDIAQMLNKNYTSVKQILWRAWEVYRATVRNADVDYVLQAL